MIKTIVLIILCHLMGDYVLQCDFIAQTKGKNWYAKPNDIILDTHVGSASSLIACYNTNHKFVGFELDEYYYKVLKQRLDTEMAQMRLSDFM